MPLTVPSPPTRCVIRFVVSLTSVSEQSPLSHVVQTACRPGSTATKLTFGPTLILAETRCVASLIRTRRPAATQALLVPGSTATWPEPPPTSMFLTRNWLADGMRTAASPWSAALACTAHQKAATATAAAMAARGERMRNEAWYTESHTWPDSYGFPPGACYARPGP